MSAREQRNIPHDDKHYRKLLRTYKLVIYMVLAALFVIGVGLLFIWIYDKLGGSFMSRGWQIFFMIVFALLAAGLQLPESTMKPKLYKAALDHARKEGLIDNDNQLLVSRAEFVRFCRNNNYFSPHGRESWKPIEGILKGPGGKTITAEQLAQTNQDIQLREGV